MGTSYRFLSDVNVENLKAVVQELGLKIHRKPDDKHKKNEDHFAVTNGTCYLWFAVYHDMVCGIDRYGNNYDAGDVILAPIANLLDVEFLSEHDEGYFDDSEEE